MSPPARKSFAYYTILVCLTIIGGAFLYGLLWQSSFAYGFITVPFLQGSLVFSLWTFAPAVLSLVLFIYYTTKTIKRRYPLNVLAPTLLLALTFLLLTFFLRPDYGYIGRLSGNSQSQQAFSVYFLLLLLIRIFVLLTLLVLLYQWRKAGRYRDVA